MGGSKNDDKGWKAHARHFGTLNSSFLIFFLVVIILNQEIFSLILESRIFAQPWDKKIVFQVGKKKSQNDKRKITQLLDSITK